MGPKRYVKKEESRLYKQKQTKTARDNTGRNRYQQDCNQSDYSTILTKSMVRQFNSQSRTQQRLKKSQSLAVIDNFDDDDNDIQTFPLEFDDKKILHLWLVNILPDTRNNKYKINLSDKKITGNKYECQMKIKQCEDHIKKYKMKSLTKLQDQFDYNFLLYLKLNQVKVFEKNVIIDVLEEIDRKFKYKNINKILKALQGSFFYLVSLKNQLETGFIQWFQENRETKIHKDLIENARKIGKSIFLKSHPQKILDESTFKKQKKKEKSDDKQQQSSDQNSNSDEQMNKFGFYGVNSNQNKVKTKQIEKKQQSNVDKLKKKQSDEKNQKNENNQNNLDKKKLKFIKKGQNIQKQDIMIKKQKENIIFKQRYSKQYLDLEDLKKWIKSNKTLKFDQFIFEDDGDSMIIMINTTFEGKRKLQAISIYFKFLKIILIHTLSAENRLKIQQKFCRQKHPYIQCKLIEGYMDPQTREHKLRTLIMEGKINKSDRFSKKFIVIWIEGLKSEMQRINNKITKFIQQLPKDDKVQNIILDLPKVQKYIQQDRVQDLCKQVIRNYITKNYQQLSIKDINIFAQKITLKLQIKHQFHQEFMKDEKHVKKLTQGIDKSIHVDQIFDSNELTTELSDKYLLLPSLQNNNKIVLIQDQIKSSSVIKEIMNFIRQDQKALLSYETNFNKGRMQLLKNYIDELNTIDKLKDWLKNIKITFEGENKIVVFGNKKIASEIHNMVNLYLAKLSNTIMEKTLIINEIQVTVVEKNIDKFKKDIQNQYKMSFNLSKGIDFGAIISINPTKSNDFQQAPLIIFIQKHNHLSKLPPKTIVCFQSQRDLNFINQKMFIPIKAYFANQKKQVINKKEDTQRQITYIYCQSFGKPEDLLNHMYNTFPYQNEIIKNYAFIMPKENKSKFILNIIIFYEKLIGKNKINIYILEQSQENMNVYLSNLQKEYKDLQKTTKYFVFDQKEFYYSKSGDQKIKNALKNGKDIVHLTNEDLSLQNITHECSFKEKKLTHIQSGKQKEIQIQNNRYLIELNGNIYQIPDKQVQKVIKQEPQIGKVQISIGIYELNFQKMQQTNLFSGFVRELKKKEMGVEKKTNHIQIDFNYKVNEIEIPYDEKQQSIAAKAIERIKILLTGQKLKTQHTLEKKITNSQFEKLKEVAKDFDIIAEWDGNQIITFTYYDKINIANLTKNMKYILSEQVKQIKYPQTWDKIEESEIKTFIVDKKTKQFEEIQKAFTLAPITELVRIQNTYVYKKYFDEKASLCQLNGGKEVRQLKLFHGTRTTDPKTIYEDKEESFNINYTSDNNFLGRGTYFAERSQYSHNYSFVNQNYSVDEPNSSVVMRIFRGRNIPAREMFYCSVLVGDSQNVKTVDAKSQGMKDTDFKNIAQRIRYQSSTTFTNGSVIYAVYKNRRAYPHYLIRY